MEKETYIKNVILPQLVEWKEKLSELKIPYFLSFQIDENRVISLSKMDLLQADPMMRLFLYLANPDMQTDIKYHEDFVEILKGVAKSVLDGEPVNSIVERLDDDEFCDV